MTLDRAAALALLQEYTQSPSLLKHAFAVEACMRAYARQWEEDELKWGVTGLLHDFDYERWPDPPDHPKKGHAILMELGYPEDIRRAILSHAEYLHVSRDSRMEKALFACDELAGFLTACALVKPSKSILEVEPGSVRRKLKDKAFARTVNRDDITQGAAALGVPLDDHIQFCIVALQGIALQLGLQGVT
ncbi:MAG: HDIG domain-containing metalloprotein [Terriglobales bacterium]